MKCRCQTPALPRWPLRRVDSPSVRYWLIMPAAGSGHRFGAAQPKQYLTLEGVTLIEHALAPFLADARCQGVVVALDASDTRFAGLAVSSDARMRTVTGGARRCDSVRNAAHALIAPAEDWVLVHDAARPCLSRADLDALVTSVQHDAVGGLLATPLADTIKRSDDGMHVADTPARAGLWRALTPQMFRLGLLRQALDAARDAGREPTDDAQAIEWQGLAPRLVEGSAANIKVTTPADMDFAAAWLQREKGA